MVTKEQIYDATNHGLDIIEYLYPDVRRITQGDEKNLSKPFKMRAGEKTPSAHLKLYKGAKTDYYIVTDFGDDQHPRNPIDLVMHEKALGFKEALVWIVSELNLQIDNINADINKPRFDKKQPADPDMIEGQWYYELNELFTEEELKVMGPMVTQDDVNALHWHSVKWVGQCKDRMITKKWSTPTYPIFMRECFYHNNNEVKSCFKKYEPKNPDKQFHVYRHKAS